MQHAYMPCPALNALTQSEHVMIKCRGDCQCLPETPQDSGFCKLDDDCTSDDCDLDNRKCREKETLQVEEVCKYNWECKSKKCEVHAPRVWDNARMIMNVCGCNEVIRTVKQK